MNSELKEKEISEYNNKEIKLFLSSEQCINAGIVLISNNEKSKTGRNESHISKSLDIKDELINNLRLRLKLVK